MAELFTICQSRNISYFTSGGAGSPNFFVSSLARRGLKIGPAVLNRRSQAAEAGKVVLSLRDNLHTTGYDFNISLWSTFEAR